MPFPDFAAAERYLNSLINYEHTFPLGGQRDWPKLEPTRRAAERLQLPLTLGACVHIAGTKGKGSVVSFLEALLAPLGPTLSFSSPHLVSVKERVRLNGQPLADALWQDGIARIADAVAGDPPIRLSYFETTLILYLWAARELQTRYHVVEAGLGGRWDATNVLERTLLALTPVDYDHTEILGHTLTEIARDKGGIIKPGATVIVGRQPVEARCVYEELIAAQQAEGTYFGQDYGWSGADGERFTYHDAQLTVSNLSLSVPGNHQRDNAAVAIRAARELAPALAPDAIRERLADCVIPGRQQLLPGLPEVLLDVAHNPVSFRALGDTLRERYAGRKILAVVGMMRDKDAHASLAAIRDHVGLLLLVEVDNPRSAKAGDLLAVAQSLGIHAECAASRAAAFERLHRGGAHDLGLVAGSFYLAGDYLIWRQHAGIA